MSWVLLHRLYPLLGTKINLAKAFRNGYVVACSTACRNATAMIELDGYGAVPCLFKMTPHSSRPDWIKIWRPHQIGNNGTRTERTFTLNVSHCNCSHITYSKLLNIVFCSLNHCTYEVFGWFIVINTGLSYKRSSVQ